MDKKVEKQIENMVVDLVEKAISEEKDIAEGMTHLQISLDELLTTLTNTIKQQYTDELGRRIAIEEKAFKKNSVINLINSLSITAAVVGILSSPIFETYNVARLPWYIIVLILLFGTVLITGVLYYLAIKRRRGKIESLSLAYVDEVFQNQMAERIIRESLREYINKDRESLITDFEVRSTTGLWSVMDATYEVPTATKDRVEKMLGELSGGSIGLAGPRGSGKSTLLMSICNPDRKTFEDQPALTVLTSVPVQYNPKEFILYLFSQVCDKVIQRETGTTGPIFENEQEDVYDQASSGFRTLVLKHWDILAFITIIGLFGMTISLGWARLLASGEVVPDFWKQMAKLIAPKDIFLISLILLIPISFFLLRLLLQILITSVRLFVGIFSLFQSHQLREERKKSMLLVGEAQRHLEMINYQLGMSTGWSGTIKLPEAVQFLESSANYSFSKTRNPQTLPEIISNYRDFLALVSQKYKIRIGIDDLDKISSSESGQQFLNETKSIFGIQGCFYLVSVSDNAMSNFERRGITFRDEFDTSFDNVFAMEFPSISYSQQLLRRRVIGLSLPFVYFCYVQSGGLPRDLIRVCREIAGLAKEEHGDDLHLAKAVSQNTLEDLRRKIRAIFFIATENSIEPDSSLLLDGINEIDTQNINISNWINTADSLVN